jgi:hypothetical protein
VIDFMVDMKGRKKVSNFDDPNKQDSYELLQYFFSFQSDYNFLLNPQNYCNLLETARLFYVGCRLYLINKNYSTLQPNALFFHREGTRTGPPNGANLQEAAI